MPGLPNETLKNYLQPVKIVYPSEASYFAAICGILFIIFGLIGNLVTFVALLNSKKLRSHATTSFVLSLTASDLLFCAINLPLTVSRYLSESWVHGDGLCKTFPFFFYGNVGTSLMSMVAITLNRFVLISSPSWYDKIYKAKHNLVMIAGIWLFSFGILLPTMFDSWGTFGLDAPTFSCTILKKDGKSPKKFLFAFGFLMPCIVIIFSYTCIYIKVRRSRLNILSHSTSPSKLSQKSISQSNGMSVQPSNEPKGNSQRKEDLRLTRMMLTIFCTFLLCFLPLMVVNIADDEITVPVLHVFASILAWASCVVNPVIYAASNRQYRAAYRALFCKDGLTTSQASSNASGRTMLQSVWHFATHADRIRVIRTNVV
ncbi:protein trapped in endoderm-1-like [Artemia franciscana]|uniref:G-protein coupled receptors family 1 profile domain-containing protein n=1 Tax=Artemia franciscana TaxID=6661 RepID=A0AA88L822_ARTSF|nr:hypothetical protein QYM36_003999 [Artemia franciscana]